MKTYLNCESFSINVGEPAGVTTNCDVYFDGSKIVIELALEPHEKWIGVELTSGHYKLFQEHQPLNWATLHKFPDGENLEGRYAYVENNHWYRGFWDICLSKETIERS